MKGIILVLGLLIVLVGTVQGNADPSHSNQVMKQCLEQYDYKPENFYSYDFSKAAKCHSDWRIAENNRDRARIKEFLKKHPWYKGSNWKWEERAEYNCQKVYSDVGPITVCSKPYYVN